jgi:glycosyltransferase involved in cell wall biosynthesis
VGQIVAPLTRSTVKITVLLDSISRANGGIFEAERRLQQSLASYQDIRVEVFGMEDGFSAQDLPGWGQIRARVFPVTGPSGFGYARSLSSSIIQSGADVLYSAGLWKYPSLASLLWAKRTGKPLLVAPHGMMDPWALRHSLLKKRMAGLLYQNAQLRQAACIRALCESELKSIRAYGLKNPVCVIPNGIDLPVKSEGKNVVTGARELKEQGRKVLLYLGRIHPKKGLINLLKAWKGAIGAQSAIGEEWNLVIAGWDQGGHEGELKSLAVDLEIEDSVLFVGPQYGEAKAEFYRNCDAFTLPSFSEGLPVSILEAWSYGKPVLMTPECNLPEGVGAGAAICPTPTVEAIEQGLKRLALMSEFERQAMGERGLRLVKERFMWSRVAHDMIAVYRWLLGAANRPDCVRLA